MAANLAQHRVRIGNLLFTSDFDSGNIGTVEKVPARKSSARGQRADASEACDAFALTVVADCAGTPYANDHRTWFHFGVRLLDDAERRDAELRELAELRGEPSSPSGAAAGKQATAGQTDASAEPAKKDADDASTSAEGDEDRGDPGEPEDSPGAARLPSPEPPPAQCVRQTSSDDKQQTIRLAILNMNNQSKLYRQGYRPWTRTLPHQPHWRRMQDGKGVDFAFTSGSEAKEESTGFCLRWNQKLLADGSTTYFAFCVPYSFSDNQELLSLLDRSVQRPESATDEAVLSPDDALRAISNSCQETWVPRAGTGIYYHRQELDRSLEDRAVDILTITAAPRAGDPVQIEQCPKELPLRGPPPRRFPGRPVVFFSARVHPGETPAQFALLGAMRLLLSDDPRAVALRERFVFKVVPMLNPDGVARGHYRTNSRGKNLNRFYDDPVREEHEAIWTVRQLLEHWAQTREEGERTLLYVDYHAHATKQGCFLLANRLGGAGQAWNMAYARMCQINSPHFDLGGCDFAAPGAEKDKKDKDGLDKEGSGRVAIYKSCRVCHCYTLECNYNTGRSANHVYVPVAEGLPSWAESPGAGMGKEKPAPYDPSCWANIGEALCISLLDLYGHNCHSRLKGSKYGSLVRLVGASHLLGARPPGRMEVAPQVLPGQLTLDAVLEREARCSAAGCCWGGSSSSSAGAAESGCRRPARSNSVSSGRRLSSGSPTAKSSRAGARSPAGVRSPAAVKSIQLGTGCILGPGSARESSSPRGAGRSKAVAGRRPPAGPSARLPLPPSGGPQVAREARRRLDSAPSERSRSNSKPPARRATEGAASSPVAAGLRSPASCKSGRSSSSAPLVAGAAVRIAQPDLLGMKRKSSLRPT